MIWTDLLKNIKKDKMALIEKNIPLGHICRFEDEDNPIEFLINNEYMTRQYFSPNGPLLFLDAPDSNFRRFSDNHGGGDLEIIWPKMKDKIKEIYHIIPTKNLMHFAKEEEDRIKIKNLSNENKIDDFFFKCKEFLPNVEDVEFFDTGFYSDNDEDSSNSDI